MHASRWFLATSILLILPAPAAMADEAIRVAVMPSYGTPEVLHVRGLVYEDQAGDRRAIGRLPFARLRKAISSALPFLRDTESEERILLRADGVEAEVVSGRRGRIEIAMPAPAGRPWRGTVRVRAFHGGAEVGVGTVYVPDPRATIGLISDIDDTIKQTGIGDRGKVVRDFLLGDATTDRPVRGMANLLIRFVRADPDVERPVFYVSASPEPLMERIGDFLRLNGFPPGPLVLLRLGPQEGASFLRGDSVFRHKTAAIRDILDAYPGMRFLLLGDASQDDARIYSAVASEYPSRVRGIYIRRAGTEETDEGDFPACVFFDSPEELEEAFLSAG
ncbi:MAG: App1 family protein [bacterium]|nr:App1 family protein [bacterium]